MELPIEEILRSLGELDGWCFLAAIALWLVSREYKRLVDRWVQRQESCSKENQTRKNQS